MKLVTATFFLFFGISFLTSCNSVSKKDIYENVLKNAKRSYTFTDKSGSFLLFEETGIAKDSGDFATKKQLLTGPNTNNPVEKNISFSSVVRLKKNTFILRPRISQYTVWLDRKKNFSQIKLDHKNRVFKISTRDSNKSGKTKEIPFPQGNGIFCFFSQLQHCVNTAGFFKMAREKGTGQMYFHIVWDGHPFFQNQYENIPSGPFSSAVLELVETNKNNETKFTLNVAGQNIDLIIDENLSLSKLYWVHQGLSIVKQ